jgi:hypothetical protein
MSRTKAKRKARRDRLEKELVAKGGLDLDTRKRNRAEANEQFHAAVALAAEHRIELRKCSPFHLQLRVKLPDERWILNIWPGQKKIWMDYNAVNAPRFTPPANWTLLELVSAVIAASS